MRWFGWFRKKNEEEDEHDHRRPPDPVKIYAEQRRSDFAKRIGALEVQYEAATRLPEGTGK